jgi:hypothetical protein
MTMPDAVMARDPIASIAGREPIELSITWLTYETGLNAGFVVKESSAAITYWAESWLPIFALMLCSK